MFFVDKRGVFTTTLASLCFAPPQDDDDDDDDNDDALVLPSDVVVKCMVKNAISRSKIYQR